MTADGAVTTPPPRRLAGAFARAHAARRARPPAARARDLVLAVAFVVFSLLYGWTIATSGAAAAFGGQPDYYGQLTTGFLHGELSIPTLPPKALVDLPDPYSPVANNPWQGPFHDLALYHGHLYLDWGPTPVIALYLPWRLLGLGNIANDGALWIFSTLGLAGVLLLFRTLVDDYLPATRPGRFGLACLALGTGTVVPFLDRTPDIYEVAVSCGFCFLAIGLYLLALGARQGARRWKLAAGSLALGLAAGARWDLLLGCLLLPPLLLWLARRDGAATARARVRLGAAILVPGGAFIFLLLVYNAARFGSPLQVGTSYQMAGFDPTKTPYYLLGYMWPSLYYYFVAPIRWTLTFPYFALPVPPFYPGAVPPTYAPEMIGGVFTTTPILVALAAAALRRRLPRVLRLTTLVLFLDALVIVVLLALGVPGGSMRYEADFAVLLLVPALLAWVDWHPALRVLHGLVAVGGTVLIVYGAVVAGALSLYGYHGQIYSTDGGQVRVMEQLTQPFPDLMTRLLGHPVITGIGSDGGVVTMPHYDTLGVGDVVYGNLGEGATTITVESPDRGAWSLWFSVEPLPGMPGGTLPTQFVLKDRTGVHRF
ncbi:MAG TPA: hypothetical protein VNF07_12740, partial [Acidimicrobiales bacterium]|nr:hypothetical protein [Acidimicrobiales bacterium]